MRRQRRCAACSLRSAILPRTPNLLHPKVEGEADRKLCESAKANRQAAPPIPEVADPRDFLQVSYLPSFSRRPCFGPDRRAIRARFFCVRRLERASVFRLTGAIDFRRICARPVRDSTSESESKTATPMKQTKRQESRE